MLVQIWNFLSTEGFHPPETYPLWHPDVFWVHVVSDTVIALSYFSIPAALLYLAMQRSHLAYHWVFHLFAAFIIAGGLTHAFGVWTLWVPEHGIEAIVKIATAVISVATAIVVWPLMPKLLALPRAEQLAENNAALEHEVAERQAAEVKLQALNEALERRVAERTESLQEVNRALNRARAEAEAGSRAKSDFLAMMSHELRTPLNAIIGFSDMIKSQAAGAGGSEKDRQYATHIHDAGQLLLELINDILDLSKIEAGSDELHAEPVDISELVPAVMTVTGAAAQRKGVALELDIPAACPDLLADPRKLKQILINLLSNAIKFTPSGGQVTLKVRPGRPEGYLFQVVDNGVGIAPENIPRALAPFQQVDGYLERSHEGTGLGLPLSNALAELHGGSLRVDSELGAGTTVTVCFPKARATCDGAGKG